MTPAVCLVKRTIDIVGSLLALVVTLPFYPVVALAIRLDSRGPVFFRQRRAGKLLGGKVPGQFKFEEFDMLKFRTMRVDAESLTGAVLATENDPRVTRVGRFLRRTRLDELPQFWNVLRGDMSIVGPRPERPELLVKLVHAIAFFEERMRGVKPGITGLAQVSVSYSGRPRPGSELAKYQDLLTTPLKEAGESNGAIALMSVKLLYDLAYVASLERFSTFMRTELAVVFKTVLVILRREGY